MSAYKTIVNPYTGELQLVYNGSALSMKESVDTYTNLPVSGNTENDLRITRDTDSMYTWTISASSGTLDNWSDIGSVSSIGWTAITGKPAYTAIDTTNGGINYVIDGGGSAITTGEKDCIRIPDDFSGTITGITLLANVSGSIVLDIWKDTYANFPPTVADTITASAKPTISSGVKSEDTTLTGWTKTLTAGDVLKFNIDSCTDITKCTVIINYTRT